MLKKLTQTIIGKVTEINSEYFIIENTKIAWTNKQSKSDYYGLLNKDAKVIINGQDIQILVKKTPEKQINIETLASKISNKLQLDLLSVKNTIILLGQKNTVSFIFHYRKEYTGSMAEDKIFEIKKLAKII
jgi:hypothetical protein